MEQLSRSRKADGVCLSVRLSKVHCRWRTICRHGIICRVYRACASICEFAHVAKPSAPGCL